MEGEVGYLIGIDYELFCLMIEIIKGVEIGYGLIFVIFDMEFVMCDE